MIITSHDLAQQFATALAGDTPLSTEQLATILSEIVTDPMQLGYSGQDAARIHGLLHANYSKLQSEQWVLKTIVTGSEIKNWIAPLKLALRLSTVSDAVKAQWIGVMGDWQGVSDTYSFDPATSTTWAGLVQQVASVVDATGSRVVSDAAIRSLTHTFVPSMTVMAGPRLQEIGFPVGAVLTLGDIEDVRAELGG